MSLLEELPNVGKRYIHTAKKKKSEGLTARGYRNLIAAFRRKAVYTNGRLEEQWKD